MSQVTSPTPTLRSQVRSHRIVVISALLALLATAAVVLVLAIDSGSSGTSPVAQEASALRTDGGPEESTIAGAVGIPSPAAAAHPDESRTAAAIAGD